LPNYHIRGKRIELVRGITQQAAIAIKNERLQLEALKTGQMERELQLAREIQTAFIPDSLPDLPGWNMDARWQPARQVGGDFYDILRLGENKIGFVIADVADKGMPAALLMTLIRTLIRAAAHEVTSPAKVLSQVNELLIPDTKDSLFVTVFYAIIDLNGGKVTYANAGHNPPIIKVYGSERLIELEPTGIALGIFNDIELETGEITLHSKDWILFYTDGVTESFSTNEEMYSKQRLFDLVQQKKYSSAKELVEAIYRSVTDFCSGQDLSDDLTLAALFRS
jgi:phosphoserine phosphatase RsbU/P